LKATRTPPNPPPSKFLRQQPPYSMPRPLPSIRTPSNKHTGSSAKKRVAVK
jgi:hypothetical protein